MTKNSSRRGIILMNLGSPDSTSIKDVKKYLTQFLMDKKVLNYPWLFRKVLVSGLIVPFRAPKSAHAYETVWTKEGSPLIVLSKQLRDAVQEKVDAPVELAMRYGNPDPEVAFEKLLKRSENLEEVVLVPLYPHYAMSSYETAVEYAREIYKKKKYKFTLKVVPPYYNEEHYINSLAERIRPYLDQPFDHLLFSYHGIPESHVRATDPTKKHCLSNGACCQQPSDAHKYCYRHQCLETMKLVTQKLNLDPSKFSYSFQSRLGREPWLQPFTDKRLEEMPGEGIKKLLIVCPAFVSDCLETLEEIEMRGKESFIESGGEEYTMIPCLNTLESWVETVAGYAGKLS